MGNKKKQNTFQMKLLALVALFAGVEAVKVHNHEFVKLAHKAKHHQKYNPKQLIKMRIRQPECPDLTAEEEEEIADAVNGMPDDLEITGQDYLDYMEANDIELTEKEMAEAEEMFHLIDTDGNGARSKDELLHAIDMYEEHCK